MSPDQSATSLLPSTTLLFATISTTTDGESPATQSTASGGDATNAITFDASKGKVYNPPSYIDIAFVLASGVKVTNVTWFVNSSGRDLQKVDGCSGLNYKNPEMQSRTRQAVECKASDIIEHLRSHLGKPMIFSIDWTAGDSRRGNASSPAFSIVEFEFEVAGAEEELLKSSYANSTVVPAKEDSTTSSSPTRGALFPAPALPTDGGNSSGTSNDPTVGASHGGHKGGLSTGAVVGIAVGVVIAALLAAALCLFFFLRRRRNKTAVVAREDQTRAEQEKLSSFPKDGGGGANASEAAIAPYRDEHILAGTGSGNARGLDEHDEHAVPLQQQPHGSLDGESGSRAAEQTPHGGVSRHLVEDGMTAAEIRRLEEEEAHLDSEIQRAGGRR